jgi:predicted PurR-regulated permease PerM
MVRATRAVGYTLWAAQAVLLPILLAMFFALVGNPILRALRRIWIPRFIGALLVLLVGLAAAAMLGRQLARFGIGDEGTDDEDAGDGVATASAPQADAP